MLGSLMLARLRRKHDNLKVSSCRKMELYYRLPCNRGASLRSTNLSKTLDILNFIYFYFYFYLAWVCLVFYFMRARNCLFWEKVIPYPERAIRLCK